LKLAGINFEKHKTHGLDPQLFSEYLLTSGLVLSDAVTWICFQGNQDFGYIYRILANTPIPDSEDGFLDDIKCYFPNLYDIKYMKHEFEELRGGLSRLGDMLGLDRIGQQHQAGSDSWLTGLAYFKLLETYLQSKDIPTEYNNILYGMGVSENDEQYLDNYTSKTEQLEREAREYQSMGDEYVQHDNYHYSNYYHPMAGHEMNNYSGDNNNNMGHTYSYSNNHLIHPSPHMPNHMGYGNNVSPMNPVGYGVSPNHMEYIQEDGQPMNSMHL
jgi:CCR4-NOT transcription complex subunit 7/8